MEKDPETPADDLTPEDASDDTIEIQRVADETEEPAESDETIEDAADVEDDAEPEDDPEATAVMEPLEPEDDAEATAVLPPVEPEPAPEQETDATAAMEPIEAEIVEDEQEDRPETVEVEEPEERGSRRGWVAWGVMATVVVLAAGYLGTAVYAAGRVPAGTTVLGTDVGGMGRGAAEEALAPVAAAAGEEPITMSADGGEAELVPAESGLAIDVEETVGGLVGFSLNPLTIMRTFTGAPREAEPVTTVDMDALVATVAEAGETLVVGAEDAVVTITDTGAAVEPAVDGIQVDADATADGIAEAWPVDAYTAVTEPMDAAVTTAEAEEYAAELNSETLVGDVEMTGPNGDATVTQDQLVRFASVASEDGELSLVIDGETLAAELESADPSLVSAATPASFSFNANHKLQTVDSQPGRAIDGAALGDAVVAAVDTEERAGELPYKETEAAITSDDLGVDDLRRKVASFDTPLTAEPIRTRNLVRGAELVTGNVLQPGETFSLLDALSPITADNGYYPAHILVDGYVTDGIGGGLSQMATTVYNAAYFAGLEDVEHRPHTKYFTRYPAGREATIFVGAIDLKFKNNTPYTLVMSSYVSGGRLYVEVWSRKHFTVETSASNRSNVTPARMTESDHDGCIDTPVGEDGFTITNMRKVYLDDELVDESSYTWTYRPNDGVRCT